MYDDSQIKVRTVNLSMNPSSEIEAAMGPSREIAERSEQDAPQILKKTKPNNVKVPNWIRDI